MAKKMENKLRLFKDCDDLFDNVDSEVILVWVNKYAAAIESRKTFQTKYQKKKRLLAQAAKQWLDADELARIEQIAEGEEDEDAGN